MASPKGNRAVGKEHADAASEGVQLRLDSTEEEKRQINNAYSACLKQAGVPTYTKGAPAGGAGEWIFPHRESPAMKSADEACRSKRPLQPVELDPKRNPDFMDSFREQINCMNKQGVKVSVLPDGSGYNYVGSLPPDYVRVEDDCLKKAFSQK
ncbi:hypothetical protein [Streptomyces sp. NBC_00568]|uniref:hypothetical protein n=1 Tax=Streptomyces sp. NBC_00568 TaxID=2975779 RepID=UPI00225AF9DA|nr:hypothetical protein [Streptomyces sp. NBC_00568]MCX4993616.1 hypothetical protein [Streptomyces sp. NBC_00568]